MKRVTWLGFGFLVLGIIAVAVVGCGQQVPQVSTTSSQPKGLTIRGTVYGNILGQSNPAQPLAGVVLCLSGDQVNRVTATDANGQYAFTDLPANYTGTSGTPGYNIVTTKEGYQRQIIYNLNFGSFLSAPVSDNSILTRDITLMNNPIVVSITPTPGTTIDAVAQTIAVVFDEVMDQTSVRPSLTSQGMRTFSIADTQTLTCSWSADSKTLYISTGLLLADKTYRLQVDPGAVAKDLNGYRLDTTGGTDPSTAVTGGGVSSTIYNGTSSTYYYRTAAGGAPGAPTGVLLTVNQLTKFDFGDANNPNSPVDLSWLAPAAGAVNGYNVYVGTSSSGPWGLLDTTNVNSSSTLISDVNNALYGNMSNADCIKQLAFVTDTVFFKVAAFNPDGETASTAVATRDATKPTLTLANRLPATAGVPAAVNTALPSFNAAPNLNMGCYLRFSEPMNLASLTDPTRYTVDTAQSVSAATIVYNSGAICVVQLTFGTAINPAVSKVTVATNGPVDLSGNVMDSTANANQATIN